MVHKKSNDVPLDDKDIPKGLIQIEEDDDDLVEVELQSNIWSGESRKISFPKSSTIYNLIINYTLIFIDFEGVNDWDIPGFFYMTIEREIFFFDRAESIGVLDKVKISDMIGNVKNIEFGYRQVDVKSEKSKRFTEDLRKHIQKFHLILYKHIHSHNMYLQK